MPHHGTGDASNGSGMHQVVDFGEARAQKLDEKRRKTERIFFQKLLSVYTVVDQGKMLPIDMIEVSEEGCSFQVPFDPNHPWPKTALENIAIRLYFSQDTYIPVHLKIQNSRPYIENGARFVRFGCSVDQTLSSYPAYQQFVRFLKMYSEHAHKDSGNVTLFYL
jgi:hypothetical protein